ncbi:BspA family leucine-rich repeat surface protein, partial [Mycoplasma capricolum subsp. capricolum]|uniref:BspA family leucine-rich repeat surface protein n=1 Tax=Mycoplasma capricolum TaxID=2095 RepID=UPI0020C01011
VSASVIACKTTDSTISETQLAQKVQTIWNDNFKNKITSAKNFSMVVEMIKEKLTNPKEKGLISLSNQDESRNRPIKNQENQKINIKIGKRNISLDFGEVKEGKKLTKYRDPKTNEIKTTDATDFSKIEELKDVKEIIEIGYFEQDDSNDNNKSHIRAVRMPVTIEKVPDFLPKEITSTRAMFSDAKKFNQDLSKWDTSNLETLRAMFQYTEKFNQDISMWDTSNVRIMEYVFTAAKEFDQDLSNWDVSNVTSTLNMFSRTEKFNNGGKPLLWGKKTSKLENANEMFLLAKEFNQSVNDWDVSNVKKMRSMFRETLKFNQSLDKWKTTNVEDMGNMFMKTKEFDQNISNWDISKLKNIEAMFLGAEKFNQNLSNWKTDNIKVYAGYHNDAKKWVEGNKLKFNNMTTESPKKK